MSSNQLIREVHVTKQSIIIKLKTEEFFFFFESINLKIYLCFVESINHWSNFKIPFNEKEIEVDELHNYIKP